jgi:ribose-phosphate pyrophosphokinase
MVGFIYGPDRESALIEALADRLRWPKGAADLGAFADGERQVRIHDDLGGKTAILAIGTGPPVDAHLMTLAFLTDACRRAGASRIVAVVPYFGYGRGDRLAETGQPVAARVVANLLEAAGISHLVTLDWHNPAIAGFFSLPIVEVSAVDALAAAVAAAVPDLSLAVSPDAGAIKRTSRLAERLGLPMAVAIKQRPASGQPKVLQVLGDVTGRHVVLVDDMITTAGTLERVGEILLSVGAASLTVVATHAVMTPGAAERLRRLHVDRLFVTDSLPWQPPADCPGWQRLPAGPLLADAVATILVPPSWRRHEGRRPAA